MGNIEVEVTLKEEGTNCNKVIRAESITIAPTNLALSIDKEQNLVNVLLNKRVNKGSIIKIRNKDKRPLNDEFGLFDIFGEAFGGVGFPSTTSLVVIDTNPKGLVLVDELTKIKMGEREVEESDIPEDKILEVYDYKKGKESIKLKGFKEILKLTKGGNFVNKYADKDKVVYFIGNYYYEIKK